MKRIIQAIIWHLVHSRSLFILSVSQNNLHVQFNRCEKLLSSNCKIKGANSFEDFVIETHANAALALAEKSDDALPEEVEVQLLYQKAIISYSRTIAWQKVSHNKRLPTNLFRAAVCYIRIGDFQKAISTLNEFQELTDSKNKTVNELEDCCKKILCVDGCSDVTDALNTNKTDKGMLVDKINRIIDDHI